MELKLYSDRINNMIKFPDETRIKVLEHIKRNKIKFCFIERLFGLSKRWMSRFKIGTAGTIVSKAFLIRFLKFFDIETGSIPLQEAKVGRPRNNI